MRLRSKTLFFMHFVTLSFGESRNVGRGEKKTFTFKIHVFSDLNFKLSESQKKVNKKLVKANKGCSFATAMAQRFFLKY